MSAHAEFRYSITCRPESDAVAHCLRALTHYSERHPQKMIAWGGTGGRQGLRGGHTITFRFTRAEYRQRFRDVANDLLGGRWTEEGARDDDPAVPKTAAV